MLKSGSNGIQVLYSYDLSHLKKSHKVRFVYLIKGRGSDKGLVEKLKGRFLASACFIISVSHDTEIQQIMDEWHIKYSRYKIILTN